MLAPLAYLLLRGLSAGASFLGVAAAGFHARDHRAHAAAGLWGVSLVSILLSVPMAWLTARSDLPFKRFLGDHVAPLPLVIPSYVGAYLFVSALGPRGLVQGWLEPLTGIQRLPDIYGFWGALLVLSLLSYPFVYLPVRAVLHHMDRSTEEAARSLGKSPWSTFLERDLSTAAPGAGIRQPAGIVVCAARFWRRSPFCVIALSPAPSISSTSPRFDRASAALLALVLVSADRGGPGA
jgi:iron(III) transport system permease protein